RVRSTRGSRKSAKYFRGLSISPSQPAKPFLHIVIKMRLPWDEPLIRKALDLGVVILGQD
ncbi:MAG: hypothetical protein ABSC47_12090, partial [Terracidiphilus sp.]